MDLAIRMPEDIPCDGIYRLTPLCPPHLLHNNRTLSSHPSIKAWVFEACDSWRHPWQRTMSVLCRLCRRWETHEQTHSSHLVAGHCSTAMVHHQGQALRVAVYKCCNCLWLKIYEQTGGWAYFCCSSITLWPRYIMICHWPGITPAFWIMGTSLRTL